MTDEKSSRRERLVQEFGEAGANAYLVEEARQIAIDEAETRRRQAAELADARRRRMTWLTAPAPTHAPEPAKATELPDAERRLAALYANGGEVQRYVNSWKINGIAELAAKEKADGRARCDEKTIRGDLKKAVLARRAAGYGAHERWGLPN